MKPQMSYLFLMLALTWYAPHALAAPELKQAFNADYQAYVDNKHNITLLKNNALMIWQNFNLQEGETVYVRKNAGLGEASVLNIVQGGPTRIDGFITVPKGNKDINFYLVNPNGITLGNASELKGFKNTYLGTSLVDEVLIDKFKNDTLPAIQMTELPDIKGMGKVKMIGDISTDNLKVNAGQIIIADAFKLTNTGAEQLRKLELHSSLNRIDIGAAGQQGLDTQVLDYSGTVRDILKDNGLTAAQPEEITSAGTHGSGKFIDHSGQSAIYDAKSFNDQIKAHPEQSFWLVDDIQLTNPTTVGVAYQPLSFSGTLDGAFNSINYDIKITDQGEDFGLFSTLDNATIKNLKLYNPNLGADASYYIDGGSPAVNIGALAGRITGNTTIEQVAVEGLNLDLTNINSNSHIGGLVGTVDGTLHLNNVTASFDAEQSNLAGFASDHLGSVLGTINGSLEVKGLVAGALDNKGIASGTLEGYQSIGYANDAQLKGMIGNSFAEGYQQAIERGEYDETSFILVKDEAGKVIGGAHKGFVKPFYLEDFVFEYDGTERNYQALTGNPYFNFSDYVTLDQDAPEVAQKNAGVYEYGFEGKDYGMGHNFYFDYAYSGETWQGDDAASRNQRDASWHGIGTLQINKKKVTVELKDQTYDEGDNPNTDVSADTIENYDELLTDHKKGLVEGDELEDLGLNLRVDNNGKITADANSQNYEVEVIPGKLTENPKPEPDPDPTPDPDPKPDPEPDPDPKPEPEPTPDPIPDPVPTPEPEPTPEPQPTPDGDFDLSEQIAHSEAERKCVNCGEHTTDDYGYIFLQQVGPLNVFDHDFSIDALASLNNGTVPVSPVEGSSAYERYLAENNVPVKQGAITSVPQQATAPIKQKTTTEKLTLSPYTTLTKVTTTTLYAPNAEEAEIMGIEGQGEDAARQLAETDDGSWELAEHDQMSYAPNKVNAHAKSSLPAYATVQLNHQQFNAPLNQVEQLNPANMNTAALNSANVNSTALNSTNMNSASLNTATFNSAALNSDSVNTTSLDSTSSNTAILKSKPDNLATMKTVKNPLAQESSAKAQAASVLTTSDDADKLSSDSTLTKSTALRQQPAFKSTAMYLQHSTLSTHAKLLERPDHNVDSTEVDSNYRINPDGTMIQSKAQTNAKAHMYAKSYA